MHMSITPLANYGTAFVLRNVNAVVINAQTHPHRCVQKVKRKAFEGEIHNKTPQSFLANMTYRSEVSVLL